MVYLQKAVTDLRNNWEVSWLEIEPMTYVLTSRQQSHPSAVT